MKVEPGWATPVSRSTDELVAQLGALYGNCPVRLSHRTALKNVLVPSDRVLAVSTSSLVSTNRRLRQLGFEQYWEPAATVEKFAEPVGGNVWRSSQARALVESAQYPHRVYDPTLLMAYGMDTLEDEVDRVVEVGEELGWSAGLQRLQSVAAELRDHWRYETLAMRIDPGFCGLVQQPRFWVHMQGTRDLLANTVAYADFANRVLWDTTPDVVVEGFLW